LAGIGFKPLKSPLNDVVQVKVINQPDKNFPNGNMPTAHAEVGAIQ
jgi:filamentous hemagglutinin